MEKGLLKHSGGSGKTMYIKRLIDIVLSLSGLILASWVYLLIAIAIKIDDPGPVFFSQKRIGKDGMTFSLFKYRSMCMSTPHDTPTHLLENPDQYITRVGKFLRKTSLDEIPQLWNILKGDMSVIGDGYIIGTTKKNLDFSRGVTA
jgi:lipopolysaccharide/colanic/teichoic acid biosynthesis glycosyltransferase